MTISSNGGTPKGLQIITEAASLIAKELDSGETLESLGLKYKGYQGAEHIVVFGACRAGGAVSKSRNIGIQVNLYDDEDYDDSDEDAEAV